MPAKRLHPGVGFALFAALAALGLFVLHGAVAGVVLLVALLVFIGACMYALRGHGPDAVERGSRAGLTGWFGGWW
jgi:hypothetical protein